MMDRITDKPSAGCESGEGLVSYLYGEMAADELAAFESHLSGCDNCTAEFAELSFARLDVYEWKRDEFAELATPRISVPYAAASRTSVLDTIRGWFAFPAHLASAAGAFAVLALVVGVWFSIPSTRDVVDIVSTGAEPTPGPANVRTIEVPVPAAGTPAAGETKAIERADRQDARPGPVKAGSPAVQVRNSGRTTQPAKIATTGQRTVPERRTAAPPRLNEFEDEDDNTLRLGDLLAEIDTEE